jgi:hypothetical protein
LLDSGSDSNCASELLCNYIGANIDARSTKVLVSANNKDMEVLGQAKINISWNNSSATRSARLCFYVVRDLYCDLLLGRPCINFYNLAECSSALVALIRKRGPAAISRHGRAAAAICHTTSPDRKDTIARCVNDSVVSGSETIVPSWTSWLTGTILSKDMTLSTTPHNMMHSAFSHLDA